MSTVDFSIQYFPDPTKGRPVFNGGIFIGKPDLDPKILINQKQVSYVLEDGTLVDADQPILTSAGGVPVYNGMYVTLDVEGSYSLRVDDKLGAQVYYVANTLNTSGASSKASKQKVTLLSGQTTVVFSKILTNAASFIVDGSVDGRTLIEGADEDYTISDSITIELTASFPGGTTLLGVSNVITAQNEDPANDVRNFDTLSAAANDVDIKDGDSIILKERLIGVGGGGLWSVVLKSSVTTDTFRFVACVTVPELALVLRLNEYGTNSPEQLGATANGVIDDSAVLNYYINDPVISVHDWPGNNYATSTTIEIKTGSRHIFNGTELTLLTEDIELLYANQVSDFSLTGSLTLRGTGDGSAITTATAETLLRVRDCRRFKIENVTAFDTTGRAYYFSGFTDSAQRSEKGGITNLNAYQCQTGFDFDAANATGSEYISAAVLNASGCYLGAKIEAGNLTWVGGVLTDNVQGLILDTGSNPVHGSLTGVHINHNTEFNIQANDIAQGMNFIGCHFYGDGGEAGKIELNNSEGIMFTGGVLGCPVRNNAGAATNTGPNQMSGMLIANGLANFGGDDPTRLISFGHMGLGSISANRFNESIEPIPLTLINSWVASTGRRVPGYYYDPTSGDVVLVGALGGGSSAFADPLPLEYRPTAALEFIVSAPTGGTVAAAGYVVINSDGTINFINGDNTKVSLEGIRFSTNGAVAP